MQAYVRRITMNIGLVPVHVQKHTTQTQTLVNDVTD